MAQPVISFRSALDGMESWFQLVMVPSRLSMLIQNSQRETVATFGGPLPSPASARQGWTKDIVAVFKREASAEPVAAPPPASE
jgi:hypothetical protein